MVGIPLINIETMRGAILFSLRMSCLDTLRRERAVLWYKHHGKDERLR